VEGSGTGLEGITVLTRRQSVRATTLLATVAILVAMAGPASMASAPPQPNPIPVQGIGHESGGSSSTYWAKTPPGSPGASSAGEPTSDSESADVPSESSETEDPCVYKPVDVVSGLPVWENHSSDEGYIMETRCPQSAADGGPDAIWSTSYQFVAFGDAPAPPPPPSPEELAQRVEERFHAESAALHLGPFPDQVAVKIPVWLWIDPPVVQVDGRAYTPATPPPPVTLTVPGLSVTATATFVSTTWHMGEPWNPETDLTEQTQECVGAGAAGAPPPSPAPARSVVPPCGYTYFWKSMPERTGGTGTWHVTVSANWDITWTASTGEFGTDRISSDVVAAAGSSADIHVGEYSSVLVAPTR
jgi:hypothetical protein